MIRRNIVRVDKDIKEGIINLWIQGIPSSQGIPNIIVN
jgi:hypothetical protein